MTTPKLKSLIKMASEIIILYLANKSTANCDTFELLPFYDEGEKDSEVVTINFEACQFDHEFLEPVVKKLMGTNISWSIGREEHKLIFNLY